MMVPTDAIINFRFKNALESDIQKFSFTGKSVSVKELKTYISSKHKLDQRSSRPDKTQAPSELTLEDLATGQAYTSDEAEIPNGSTVIVARKLAGAVENGAAATPVDVVDPVVPEKVVALTSRPISGAKRVTERAASDLSEGHYYQNAEVTPYGSNHLLTGKQDPRWVELGIYGVILENTDISELDWPEDKKILAMQYQCLLFYDHTVFTRPSRSSQGPTICQKCGGHGHWAKNCNAAMDYNQPGPAPRRGGGVRAPTVLATTATANPAAYASVPVDSPDYEDIPPDLRCGICQNLIRDAMRVPCCDKSFCDSCIRNLLINDSGSTCPNCKSEIQVDQCLPNSFVRESVERWEREMQIKRQMKREETVNPSAKPISSIQEGQKASFGKEHSTQGSARNNQYIRPQSNITRNDSNHFVRNRHADHHVDSGKSSSEPMPIGSVLSRAMPAMTANMFHQPQTDSSRVRPGFPINPALFMGNAPRARAEARPSAVPGPMSFFPPQFAEFAASYMGGGYPPGMMDPAAFAMRSRMPNAGAAYMANFQRFPGFMGNQTVESMFKAQQQAQQQMQRTFAAAQQQQQQQSQTPLPGPNLRITRTPNQPKVPVLSPYEAETRRSPEKMRSSDDYREKDRRDKDDERRRDDRKYDDRERRSGEKRRESHDDRRSPDRRRDSRERVRTRAESPDRRDRKKELLKLEELKPMDKDEREKVEVKKERRKDDGISSTKSGSATGRATSVKEVQEVRPDRLDRSRPKEIDAKEKDVSLSDSQPKIKVEPLDVTPVAVREVKKAPQALKAPQVLKEPSKEAVVVKFERVITPKPVERQVSAAAPKRGSPVLTPSLGIPSVPLDLSVQSSMPAVTREDHTHDRDEISDTSEGLLKEQTVDHKRDKVNKDKEKSSRISKKERKPSKSSREKRPRSESVDKRNVKKRSDKKKPTEEEGVFLEHIQHADVEEDPAITEEVSVAERRSHKTSRSRKDKKSTSSRSKRPRSESMEKRDSKKRESRKASENDEQKPLEKDKEKDRKKDRSKRDKSEKREKSSHKSSKSRREKSSRATTDKREDDLGAVIKDRISHKKESRDNAKVFDARTVLNQQKARRDTSVARSSDKDRERDQDRSSRKTDHDRDRERSSRKSDQVENHERTEDVVEAEDASKSKTGRTLKSKSRKDKEKSSKEKQSRSSTGEKKRHKKKQRKEKGDSGELKSPLGEDNSDRNALDE